MYGTNPLTRKLKCFRNKLLTQSNLVNPVNRIYRSGGRYPQYSKRISPRLASVRLLTNRNCFSLLTTAREGFGNLCGVGLLQGHGQRINISVRKASKDKHWTPRFPLLESPQVPQVFNIVMYSRLLDRSARAPILMEEVGTSRPLAV